MAELEPFLSNGWRVKKPFRRAMGALMAEALSPRIRTIADNVALVAPFRVYHVGNGVELVVSFC